MINIPQGGVKFCPECGHTLAENLKEDDTGYVEVQFCRDCGFYNVECVIDGGMKTWTGIAE